MSLTVYLNANMPVPPRCGSGIFIRRGGVTVEVTREEWDLYYPGREPVVFTGEYEEDTRIYDSNITHNLARMARVADLYTWLWHPEEVGAIQAKDLIEPLARGLTALRADPDLFKKYNPPNGWGNYDGLVSFVEQYLNACQQYPEATVHVSR